uniref:Transposase MuDR plant domain-containing protein n=1 Tax=Brassica oleracea var. oleracea TaxID=109376 RepID=A0A0D3ACD3_BRAOL
MDHFFNAAQCTGVTPIKTETIRANVAPCEIVRCEHQFVERRVLTRRRSSRLLSVSTMIPLVSALAVTLTSSSAFHRLESSASDRTGSWDKTVNVGIQGVQSGPEPTQVGTYLQLECVYSLSLVGNRLVVETAGMHVNIFDLRNMSQPEQRRRVFTHIVIYRTRCVRSYPNGTEGKKKKAKSDVVDREEEEGISDDKADEVVGDDEADEVVGGDEADEVPDNEQVLDDDAGGHGGIEEETARDLTVFFGEEARNDDCENDEDTGDEWTWEDEQTLSPLLKNSNTPFSGAKCADEESSCPWRVYCSYEKSKQKLMIKVYVSEHECEITGHSKFLKCSTIAMLFAERLRLNPKITKHEISSEIQREYRMFVSVEACGNAKIKVMKQRKASHEEHFNKIWNIFSLCRYHLMHQHHNHPRDSPMHHHHNQPSHISMHHHHNQPSHKFQQSHEGQRDGNKPCMNRQAQKRRDGDDGFHDLDVASPLLFPSFTPARVSVSKVVLGEGASVAVK